MIQELELKSKEVAPCSLVVVLSTIAMLILGNSTSLKLMS